MTNVIGTPRGNLLGTDDQSIQNPVSEALQLPQHLPLFQILARRGSEDARIHGTNGIVNYFGSETFQLGSPYYTHATHFLVNAAGIGNQCMVKRLKPENAKTAFARLSAEFIPCLKPLYERNPDGSIRLELVVLADGISTEYRPVTVKDAVTNEDVCVNGYNIVLHLGGQIYPYNGTDPINKRLFGNADSITEYRNGSYNPPGLPDVKLGMVKATDGTEVFASSTLVPLFDVEHTSFGSAGDLAGLRITAPSTKGNDRVDGALAADIRSFLYRVSVVERPTPTESPIVKKTIGGDLGVLLSLQENVRNPRTRQSMSFQRGFPAAYNQALQNSYPIEGLFKNTKVYHAQINVMLDKLVAGETLTIGTGPTAKTVIMPGEKAYDTEAALYGRTANLAFGNQNSAGDYINKHLINVLTGADINAVPFWTINTADSVTFGGVAFNNGNIVYASGGDDGLFFDANGQPDELKNLQVLDKLTKREFENFGDLVVRYRDRAQYPFRVVYDSGFSIETKLAMMEVMGRRPDVYIVEATFSQADYDAPVLVTPANPATNTPPVFAEGAFRYRPEPTIDETLSILSQLNARAQLYPESSAFGTPVMRVMFMTQSGIMPSGTYDLRLPMTYDLMVRLGRYMGAGNGRWVSAFSPDRPDQNVVTELVEIDNVIVDDTVRDLLWANNAIYVQFTDVNKPFYPAMQSGYGNQTSVLNSVLVVAAACDLNAIHDKAWRLNTGGLYTQAQLIERTNRNIVALAEGRYDNKVIVEPETFFTGIDSQLGYQYTSRIHMYAPNMITVGNLSLVAHRIEDLAA